MLKEQFSFLEIVIDIFKEDQSQERKRKSGGICGTSEGVQEKCIVCTSPTRINQEFVIDKNRQKWLF